MHEHYYKEKVVKMGKWTLYPLDTEAWMSEQGSLFFKKYFGVPKGLLMVHDPFEHAYVPESYFKILHDRIRDITTKDKRGLEKILKKFYSARKTVKKNLVRYSARDYSKLSNKKLIDLFQKNREQVHHITVFDQFGWLAEEYWTPLMEEALKRAGLKKGEDEYHKTLFALTKPKEISTTLSEKRDILKSAIRITQKKSTIETESEELARVYGWMPVFAFGDAWDKEHYKKDLDALITKSQDELIEQFEPLKNYSGNRNREIKAIVKKYKIASRDLQLFIDFGLALDARNEAEYCLSFGGYYVRPMYEEIAKRLFIPISDLRLIYEHEIALCLQGRENVMVILKDKRGMVAYGYDKEMKTRINLGDIETRKLFKHLESYVQNIQGGDEFKGTCASSGMAEGIARIIPHPDQNARVNDGDILITHATTVDYLPAMKKAAAIVTEVGGLTCHAAVVSREFGIPCVVALKNAMKNFKDGDLIEVNADRGLVTVIKKAEAR